jgi:hypothetical protein
MNLRTGAIILAVGVAVGGALVWFLYPRVEYKLQTQTKVETQVQVRTVTRTVKEPGGRVVIEQETTDTSKVVSNAKSVEQKLVKPNYMVSVTAGVEFEDLEPVYGGMVQMRVFGPVFAGAYGRTDGEFGLSISLEF